jgi:ubiquinone/menaquinone biosynthesis C-methylase UbiE
MSTSRRAGESFYRDGVSHVTHPVFARAYALLAGLGEHTTLGRWRSEVLAGAHGRLLVVGVGPGYDLDHVPPTVTSVVAVDPEPTMLRLATARSGERTVPVHLVRAMGERLPLADDSVDAVLCALVLCTVDDPTAVLAEAHRVLRPSGVLLLLEHVRARDGSRLGRLQDTMTPLWRRAAGGCHLDRRTRALVRAAGFDDAELVDGPLATGLPWCLPHLRGPARLP